MPSARRVVARWVALAVVLVALLVAGIGACRDDGADDASPRPGPGAAAPSPTAPSPTTVPVEDPAWQLGVFRGSLRPDYVRAHEQWLGRRVSVVLEMIPSDSWKAIDDPSVQIDAWAGTPYEVVFTTPMVPKGGATLAQGVAGEFDDHWRRFARTFVDRGRPDAVIRLGHEFNHTFYPWSASGGKEGQYAEYYRRIVTTTREVEGSELRFVWNVLSGVETADVAAAYPGDAYVDIVSLDVYDGAQDVPDFEARWHRIRTQPFGLDWLRQFAAHHGKPMAFDEWALVKSTNPERRNPSGDSGDNTVFIERMLDFFEAEDVLYAGYFDWQTKHGWTDSRIYDGPYPNASEVYLRRVQGGSPAPPTG